MLIFVEEGKLENSGGNPQTKGRTNNKLNPHVTSGPGIKPRSHWRKASALTTAPYLPPQVLVISLVIAVANLGGGGPGGPPPLFWVEKEEMTEGRKTSRASKYKTFPPPLFTQYLDPPLDGNIVKYWLWSLNCSIKLDKQGDLKCGSFLEDFQMSRKTLVS